MAKTLNRYTFSLGPTGHDCVGDIIYQETVIAQDLEHAKNIMINGYGPDIVNKIDLIGQEKVVLFDKNPTYNAMRFYRFIPGLKHEEGDDSNE